MHGTKLVQRGSCQWHYQDSSRCTLQGESHLQARYGGRAGVVLGDSAEREGDETEHGELINTQTCTVQN
jgi:hypothetical protein